MDGGPLASLDILESIANQLQDDADARRLRLVCRAAQQAVDRVCVRKSRLPVTTHTQTQHHGKEAVQDLSQRFPNIQHLILAVPASGLRTQAEEESANQLLHAISQLKRCTHLEVSMPMRHSTRLVPALGSLGLSSTGPGSSRHTGLPLHVWDTLTQCCPPSVTHLTLPYDTWRQPAPSAQQQSAADVTETPSSPQHHHQAHMTPGGPSSLLDTAHGQPWPRDTGMAQDSAVGDTCCLVAGGSKERGINEGGGDVHGGGDDTQGLGADGSSSSSSSSSSSEGGAAAFGWPASASLPEGARAAAAQIAIASTTNASGETKQDASGNEDCSISNSSSTSCGENRSRTGAGGNAVALEDGGAGSNASSDHFGNEAGPATHAELEGGAMSSAQAEGNSLPFLDQGNGGSSNPLPRFLDACPHISSLALTGSTCCWSREELASIAALRGITRLCGLSVTSLDIRPLTNIASSLQHLEICLPDSPHPDEQDPSSYVAQAPANTVSSLILLTHLDLWGYSGNPTHLLLQLASLPYLTHLSLFGLASPHADRIDDLALRALGLLPALTSFGADQIRITEASADAEDGLCLSQLTRLEVGQRVVSFLRLPRVFPNVQDVKLQWLWEQSMRKLAGWSSITSLYLSHLSYCVDWRLLRTLQNLRHLSLDGCSSMSLLAQLLHLCTDLPCLSCLSLSYWGLEMVEQRQQQQQQQRQQQVMSWQQTQQQQQQQEQQGQDEQSSSPGLRCQQDEELRGPIDAAVAQMSCLTQLERLEMSHCPAALLVDGLSAPPNLKELHLSGIPLSSQGLVSLVLGKSQDVVRAREEGEQSSKPVPGMVHSRGEELAEVQQNTSSSTTASSDRKPHWRGRQSSAPFSEDTTEVVPIDDASSSKLRPGSSAELTGSLAADGMGSMSAAAEQEAACNDKAEITASEQEKAVCGTADCPLSGVTAKLGAFSLSTSASQPSESTGHGAGGTHESQDSTSTILPKDGSILRSSAAAAAADTADAAAASAPLGSSTPSPSRGASVPAPLHSLHLDSLGGPATAAKLRVGLCQLSGLTRLEVGPMPAPVDHQPAPIHHSVHPHYTAGISASGCTAVGADTILMLSKACPKLDILWRE